MSSGTALLGCVGALMGCILCLFAMIWLQSRRIDSLREMIDLQWHRMDRIDDRFYEHVYAEATGPEERK